VIINAPNVTVRPIGISSGWTRPVTLSSAAKTATEFASLSAEAEMACAMTAKPARTVERAICRAFMIIPESLDS